MSPNRSRSIRLLQDILTRNVAERPDKVALICENQRWTYAQIDAMSSRLASAFRQNGVQDGDRILFYLLNSAELVVSIFAALKANAVYSSIDYANTPETLGYIAGNCEATALVTYAKQAEMASHLMDEQPSLKFAVVVGSAEEKLRDRLLSFETIQKDYLPETPPQNRIEGDLAYLIYTSGSTGKSKGVLVTHRSILFTIHSGIDYFHLTDQEVHTSPLQLSFSPGINQLFQTFRVGGTLILEKSLTFPQAVLKRMEAERATSFAGVPTMLALLMQIDLTRYDLSSLRLISSIGAALPPALIEKIRQKLPNVSIYSYYGMAEASYSLGLDPRQIDLRPTSVGKPFPGTQAWIIDDDGQRLGADQIGVLILRGTHVRNGYWNYPEGTAQRFRAGLIPGETICYTGDMFRTDAEGYFYFVGRSDEIIKSGAKKVVPREIENALYGMEGVLEAAAVGIPDPILGQVIKAFVVPTEQARPTLTADGVLSFCKQSLEAFKVPRQVEIRESLPKTPSGKIIKTNLA
jgi:acyl-coenzyme A synthetase/AMP-(fatty) acid ligase